MAEQQVSHWKQTIIAAMTSYIDAGSIVAGAAGLTLWQTYLGLSSTQVGLVTAFSSNAGGAAIGALIGGPICDKYGRKFVYTYDLILYMLAMLLIVFAQNFWMLFIGYFLVGLAVGADVVASWTLIAEQAPAENRARHCGTAQFAWAIGPAVVLLLNFLLGHILGEENALLGNRIVFAHLIVVAFITWFLRLKMPESENWKKSKEAEKALIASRKVNKLGMVNLLKPVNLKTVLFLCGVYVIWNLCAGTMGMFLPYIYETVGGISNATASGLTVILFITSALATALIFMPWADRISRRLIYFLIGLCFVVAWGLFLLPTTMMENKINLTFVGLGFVPFVFVLISILMGVNNGSGQQAFYQLWCGELFPAYYRSSAQGFTFFAARLSLMVWSYFLPGLIKHNYHLAFAIMVAFAVISLMVGTIWTPKTSGKTLDQITEERYGSQK
ncbi:MAG: MFS transporter [Planctomycetia bacterium]|nr:MFS transporter [Planctomycetia bacterium]